MSRLIVLISFGFFTISLGLPAFYVERGGYWYGIFCLLFGWLGLGECIESLFSKSIYTLSWLANPVILVAWILLIVKQFKYSFACSSLAFLLCLVFLVGDKTIVANEAGGTEAITDCGTGYYLWMSSFVVMLLGNGLLILYDILSLNRDEIPLASPAR